MADDDKSLVNKEDDATDKDLDTDKDKKTEDQDADADKDKDSDKDADKDQDGKADKVDGAPEEYKDFDIHEGMELDKASMEKFKPLAKDFNLSQEQAQKLVSFQSDMVKDAAETQEKNWNTLQDEWIADSKSDKEIGGNKFDENLKHASLTVEKFGTPELRAMLDRTGAGNHVEVIRIFSKIGKLMSEDKIISGKGQDVPVDAAKLLFPDQK